MKDAGWKELHGNHNAPLKVHTGATADISPEISRRTRFPDCTELPETNRTASDSCY